MQHNRLSFRETLQDLAVGFVALAELHIGQQRAALCDTKHRPALAAAEEGADRDLQHVLLLPDHGPDLDTERVAEQARVRGWIDEVDDDVDALLLDAERRHLSETRR